MYSEFSETPEKSPPGFFRGEASELGAAHLTYLLQDMQYGSFRKLGVPYFGVLVIKIRILLFRVLY